MVIERNNIILSLIRAIGEMGLCICSIYEIENNAVIGLSGAISATISLFEIWKDTKPDSEEEEQLKNEVDSDGAESTLESINNNSHCTSKSSSNKLTQAHVCPPVVHIHSNPT
eukprot:gene11874-14524_t